MTREQTIYNLNKELSSLSKKLKETYDSKVLAKFLEVEKEIEIQKAYKAHEGK